MKSARGYMTIGVIGLVSLAVAYFYQQYLGEDIDPDHSLSTSSVINKRLNAIVTDTSKSKVKINAFPVALQIDYKDMETQEASRFFINYPDRTHVTIGDTVTKDKGEKLVLIYSKQGTVSSVPVE